MFFFFIDKKVTGYCTHFRLIEKLGYNRILQLARNGLIINHQKSTTSTIKSSLLEQDEDIPNFTIQDEETRHVFTINGTKYYAHRDLLLIDSKTYKNINSMISDKGNICLDIKNIDPETVKIYLQSFYRDTVNIEIKSLNIEQLFALCELVQRIPSKRMTIQTLEPYIIKTYDIKYQDYYQQLISTNELYNLVDQIYR